MEDISIYPKRGLFNPIYSPNTGKSTLVLGSSFSGKTTLIVKELNKLKPTDYTCILFFTESRNSEAFKLLKPELNVIIKEGWDPNIVLFLKGINDICHNKFRFCVILDDVIDLYHSKTLNKLILLFRNANIWTTLSLQYPNLVSKSSRSSFHQVVICGSRTSEWWKETSNIMDLREWYKKLTDPKLKNSQIYEDLKQLTKDKDAAIYLNLREGLEPAIVDLH